MRRLTFLAALAISALISNRLAAHDGPEGHSHGDPAAKAAHEMAHAASNLWSSLTDAQKAKAGFAFKDDQRYDWHFIPRPRKGLPWKEMTPAQQALAHGLLASGMSSRGYIQAETIMSLEEILKEIEQGKGPVRDSELYYFSIFGTPGDKEPWGWRVEGHHLSLNFTVIGGKGAVGGPTFMGANPGEVRVGARKGLRTLAHEEDIARKLVKALSDDQKKKGIVSADAPKDIISFVIRKAKPIEPAGILGSDLNAEQKALLTELVTWYAEKLRPEISSQDLAKIMKSGGIDKVGFAWAGGVEPGQPHYYRVQGPTFLLEYDNTQNDANHIHSVWRDYESDFGEDLLKRHYETAPGSHGHDAEKK